MSSSQIRVRALIRDIRTRWRRRAVLQGSALTAGVLALWGVLMVGLYRLVDPPPIVLLILAVAGGLLVVALAVHYVVRPALRRITDHQIAMLIEERVPALQDRLNSAVELDDPDAARRAHGALVDRLIDDAAERARSVPLTTVVDRHKERIFAGASGVALAVFLVLGYTTLDDLRVSYGSTSLSGLMPRSQPYMTVDPGDVEIEQGQSQEVIVTLREDKGRDVLINYRAADGSWQKEPMQQAVGEPSYLHEFLSVQQPVEYFVEHDQQRSDVFTISLYTFPSVQSIDVTYTYPDYTGQPPRTERNTGDVYGLRGSTVTFDIATSGNVAEGELVFTDGRRIPLRPDEEGRYRATMSLEREGYYSVRLVDRENKENKFPDEFAVVPFDDERPRITITDPQRDVRANAVEEVLVAALVHDDFGVEDVRLRFAVNAGEERTVRLLENSAGEGGEVTGEHVFFLEDYALEPGDVISYFVEAEDGFHETPEMTDMYFIEVIPFDQQYSQVAGGGMQGGGQSGIVLNQQQIIAATWKLHREREQMNPDEYGSSVRSLVQAQENLRSNIEQRISGTAFSLELQNEENQRIVEHLRSAVRAMGDAVTELRADRLREALTPEREALNALLKADAINREQQVALNRGNQGGGGGGATEERMTELMDLELDISKDKYEVLPERSGSSGSGAESEALQKLRELARRQQNLANESRNELEGEDRRRQVERLQRDQDELRREAQQLARQMSSAQTRSGEAQQQLDRITESMREAEEALREGDTERARSRQQRAINELERMVRDMQVATNDDRRERLDALNREFDAMREREEQLARDIQQTANEAQQRGGQLDRERLDELAEQRRAIRDELERLRQQLDQVAEENADDPELAAAARGLQRGLQREALDEQMADSERALERGWLDNAQRREESIRRGMERLEEEMQAFAGRLPETDEERLARTLESLQELERELRRLQENDAPGAEGEQSERGAAEGAAGEGTPGASGQSGDDRASRAEQASREARLDRARDRLRQMQENLRGTDAGSMLDRLSRGMARADHVGVSLTGEAAREFFEQEIFAPLSQLEEALARELDRIDMERKLHGSRPGDVPPEYRSLVERYYESLSKSPLR